MSRKFLGLFEHHRQPVISQKVFLKRMVKCIWVACLLLMGCIYLGAAVYRFVEGMGWVDATMNAVMVMTGLGLVDTLHNTGAKIFTIFYAIIAAIVFYLVLAIIFAPLIHRFLHQFHLEMDQEDDR